MKAFIGVIGMLTIAQWLFIGLLWGFLGAQGKTTPETMSKLHDFPVIGGYFPKVKIETPEDKQKKYGDDLRERLVDARRQWGLPPSYNDEEFAELLVDIKERGDRLKIESRKLEKLKLEARSVVDEINRREKLVTAKMADVSKRERALLKTEAEVELQKTGQDAEAAAQALAANKKIAKWLNQMTPEAALQRLTGGSEDESDEEKANRYRAAAQLLTLMDEEQAAKVIEIMEPVDWVIIEEMKRAMPVSKK